MNAPEHYTEKEIKRVIGEMLKAIAEGDTNDPDRARLARLLKPMVPVIIRFQLEELNRGQPPGAIIGTVCESFGYWLSTFARQVTGRHAPPLAVLQKCGVMVTAIAQHATANLGADIVTTPQGEEGGHA